MLQRLRIFPLILATFVLVLRASVAHPAPRYSILDLSSVLPVDARPVGLDDRGRVAGTFDYVGIGEIGFLTAPSTPIDASSLLGSLHPRAISPGGLVVAQGGSTTSWAVGVGGSWFPFAAFEGWSTVYSVSDGGYAVGLRFSRDVPDWPAEIYSVERFGPDGMKTILEETIGARAAVNASGRMAGERIQLEEDLEGFIPRSSTFEWNGALGVSEIAGGYAALNDLGDVVGRADSWLAQPGPDAALAPQAFGRIDGTFIDFAALLGHPPAALSASFTDYSTSAAINNRREIVGNSSRGAFYYAHGEGRMALLVGQIVGDHAFTSLEAVDINESGQIVGTGFVMGGQRHAFLMTPIDCSVPGHCPVDTVRIHKALYAPVARDLVIRASSSRQPHALLSVAATILGSSGPAMALPWQESGSAYLSLSGFALPAATRPTSVVVTSSLDGSATTTRVLHPATTGDFDGDLRTDLTLYDAASGTWTIRLSQSGILLPPLPIGGPAFVAAPGDYDGDGLWDLGIYAAASGLWIARSSGTGEISSWLVGGTGAIPIAADYDGDGRTDPAVFGTEGGWKILRSASGYSRLDFTLGAAGWTPVSGDFGRDGVADATVLLEPTGHCASRLSTSTGAVELRLCVPGGGVPRIGDFDGDGKLEVVAYVPATGAWNGSSSHLATLGGPGWEPVPGDYDGDGKTDVAVFRPGSDGGWQILESSTGTLRVRPADGPGAPPTPRSVQ